MKIGDTMKIEKIKKLNNGKYKIVLDNADKITTYDDVILKNNLLFDKEIDFEELKSLNKQTTYYDIYNKIIKMIATKYRSEKEIRKFLQDKEITETEKKELVEKLKEIGMIDDIRFMKAYISDRMHLSSDGPYLIKKDLLDHGMDENKVEEEISHISEKDIIEKIHKLVGKKIKSNTKYSIYILKQKLIGTLQLKGFDPRMIAEVFDTYEVVGHGPLEKEYQKVSTKLSKKYEGNELYYQIKQKLYSKGFASSEIEGVMQDHI